MHAWFWKQLANNSQEAVFKPHGSKAGAGWFPLTPLALLLMRLVQMRQSTSLTTSFTQQPLEPVNRTAAHTHACQHFHPTVCVSSIVFLIMRKSV